MILADIIGGLPVYSVRAYIDGFKSILDIKKGKFVTGYAEEIKLHTLINKTSFTEVELNQMGDFLNMTEWTKGKSPIIAMLGRQFDLKKVWPKRLYQVIEEGMKSAVYINARKQGKSIGAAEKLAQEALFDYSKVPPVIRWARHGYSPFITFSYKAIPALTKATLRKPWKTAKYIVAAQAYETLRRRQMGETAADNEHERRNLPDYMQRDTLPGMPSHIKIGGTDEDGRVKYWDISYLVPWGDVTDEWGQLDVGFKAILPNNPIWNYVGDVMHNEDTFLGRQLVLDHDTDGEKYLKLVAHAWKQVAPGIIAPDKWAKLGKAWRGETDRQGRQKYSVAQAAFDVFLGLKLRKMDMMEQQGYRVMEVTKIIESANKEFVQKYELYMHNSPNMAEEVREEKMAQVYVDLTADMERLENKMYFLTGDDLD